MYVFVFSLLIASNIKIRVFHAGRGLLLFLLQITTLHGVSGSAAESHLKPQSTAPRTLARGKQRSAHDPRKVCDTRRVATTLQQLSGSCDELSMPSSRERRRAAGLDV